MANEVEIVISARNKAKPAVEAAKKDAEGLGRAYKDVGRTATSALGRVRDALTKGLRDAVADVNGETNRMSRAWRAVADGAASSFDRVKTVVRGRLADVASDAVKRGRDIGGKLVSGIVGNVKASATRIKGTLHDAFSGGIKGVLSTPVLGPVIISALAGVAALAGPALGSVIAGSLVMGIGSALAGLGIASLFHVEEINEEWSKAEQERVKASNKAAEKLREKWRSTWRDVVSGMREAAQPMLPVLDTARSMLVDVGRHFKPAVEQAFKSMKGPLQDFTKNFGEGLKNLEPAIAPLTTAFTDILGVVGPALPGFFETLSGSLIDLATTVSENKDIIGALFMGLLETLPLVIDMVSGLTSAMRPVLSFMISGFETFLGIVANVVDAIGHIPGMEDWARETSASIRGTMGTVAEYKAQLDNFPKVVKLEGNIRDLDSKIKTARRQLNDKNLTKTRRAKLEARIEQLLAAKRRAQAAIDSLRGKVVNVHVSYTSSGRSVLNGTPTVGAYDRARGGIIGATSAFASGGISGAGGSVAMVGEQGPELVRLPFGSTVVPAGTTRAMMNPATSGFNSVSMAFRAATGGGSGGAGDLASGLRDLTKALREVISLREGMDKLTGSVFNQERALSAYEAAWDAARKSLKENGRRLSLSTEKGRENRGALLSLAEAAQDVVAAMAEKGRSITAVTKKMSEQRLEFIRIARAMGLTTKQAKALADRYGLIPRKVKTVLTEERKDLAYNRKAEAYNKKIEKAQQGKATGGIAGGWTLVGERGAELVRLPYGSTVVPNGTTQAMLAGSGGGGGGRMVLEINSSGSRLDDLLVELLRRAVRTRGGNVQTVLGR